jgi:hypothetical protein
MAKNSWATTKSEQKPFSTSTTPNQHLAPKAEPQKPPLVLNPFPPHYPQLTYHLQNIDTFPILTDLGLSTTVAFLNPCGINTPHVHPRATEFLTVVQGAISFGMILENGLVDAGNKAEINGTLQTFQGTVLPVGSIHYQFNPTCEPAVFVATLNSEDPGTSQVAQGFFGLNGEVVNATLGFPKTLDGRDIESFRQRLPANLAQAVDTCLAACQQ